MFKISPINYNFNSNKVLSKAQRPDISFCANQKADDQISAYLEYLGRINREIVIPDDEFEERSAPPKLNIVSENPQSGVPDINNRKEKYLRENNLRDLPPYLRHNPENFFIKIEGYGKDYDWANFIAQSADFATLQIANNEPFRQVIDTIASDLSDYEMSKFNENDPSAKALGMGILRLNVSNANVLATPYGLDGVRYAAYGKRFSNLALKASKNVPVKMHVLKTPQQFSGFCPTQIYYYPRLKEGKLIHNPQGIESALKYSEEIYDNLLDYKDKKLAKKDIKEINKQIATMHWLLANSAPYMRGSDSIVNTLVKSLYAALGFELSAPKEGISFDLEAFSRELKDYIKKYPSLYENEPKYVL